MGFWAVFYSDYGKAIKTNPTSSDTRNKRTARVSDRHAKHRSLERDDKSIKAKYCSCKHRSEYKPQSPRRKYHDVNVVSEIYAHKRQAIAKIKRESPVNMRKGIGTYKKTSAIIAIFNKENS